MHAHQLWKKLCLVQISECFSCGTPRVWCTPPECQSGSATSRKFAGGLSPYHVRLACQTMIVRTIINLEVVKQARCIQGPRSATCIGYALCRSGFTSRLAALDVFVSVIITDLLRRSHQVLKQAAARLGTSTLRVVDSVNWTHRFQKPEQIDSSLGPGNLKKK